MGKIGSYSYPDISLSVAIDIAKKIIDEFRETELEGSIGKESLAGLLGHSTVKSGGFAMKVTALHRYGLGGGRGEFKTTDLAKKLTSPKNSREKEKMMEKALRNVELFDKILDNFGVNPPKEKFGVKLNEITDAERLECEEKASTIHKLFIEGAKHIKLKKKAIRGELKLGGSAEWKAIGSAFKLDAYVSEPGYGERKSEIFNNIKNSIQDTNLEKTRLVIESYSDVIKGDGTKITERMSKRILEALADDVGVKIEEEKEGVESGEEPNK